MADPTQDTSIHPDLQPRSNLVQAGSSTGTAPASTGQAGVTYDEGEGVKQTVMISGPMSEAYTRALHLCFTKDTVQDPADIENEVPAIESQQEDNSIISSVIAEVEAKVDNNTLEKVGSTFDFADVKDDLDDDNAPIDSKLWRSYALGAWMKLERLTGEQYQIIADGILLISSGSVFCLDFFHIVYIFIKIIILRHLYTAPFL